jgi:hypothetical protein
VGAFIANESIGERTSESDATKVRWRDCKMAHALWSMIHEGWGGKLPAEAGKLPTLPEFPASLLARNGGDAVIAAAERAPSSAPPTQYYRDMIKGGEFEKAADERWNTAWAGASRELEAGIAKQKAMAGGGKVGGSGAEQRSVLVYLFSRFGFECGRFARLLHKKAHMSWGTYQDALCSADAWHCNAHANNLVIMAPGNSEDSYVGCSVCVCVCVCVCVVCVLCTRCKLQPTY